MHERRKLLRRSQAAPCVLFWRLIATGWPSVPSAARVVEIPALLGGVGRLPPPPRQKPLDPLLVKARGLCRPWLAPAPLRLVAVRLGSRLAKLFSQFLARVVHGPVLNGVPCRNRDDSSTWCLRLNFSNNQN